MEISYKNLYPWNYHHDNYLDDFNKIKISAFKKKIDIYQEQADFTNLIKQYEQLIATEGVHLNFTEEAIAEVASIASKVNEDIENIGARRLHTILEKVLEEISFSASEKKKDKINIDDKYVQTQIGDIYKDTDLTKFIL